MLKLLKEEPNNQFLSELYFNGEYIREGEREIDNEHFAEVDERMNSLMSEVSHALGPEKQELWHNYLVACDQLILMEKAAAFSYGFSFAVKIGNECLKTIHQDV